MARKSSPARLVIALSVAAVLAIFLLYTSLAGGGTPSVAPSELAGKTGEVALAGRVVGTPTGDPHGAGMRFVLVDIHKPGTKVTVLYKGSVPDMFRHRTRSGRDRDAARGRGIRVEARDDDHEVPVEVPGLRHAELSRG